MSRPKPSPHFTVTRTFNPKHQTTLPPEPEGEHLMTYLVTALNTTRNATVHQQHMLTMARVQRLIDLLVRDTDADTITIDILRVKPTDDIQLRLP